MNARGAQPRLLFIARAFPPTLGGMENFALQLSNHLRAQTHVTTLVNPRGKRALPAFLPYALLAGVRAVRRDRIDAIHLADSLLAPLGVLLRSATGVPVTASVCGLDVTYPNRAYQAVVPRALTRLDMTMPISAATAAELARRSAGRASQTVIPLGVNPLPVPGAAAEVEFRARASIGERDRVLLTVGRLIRRKGASWLVAQVLTQLPPDVVYVLIGEGPERDAILGAAVGAGVRDRVRLLGRVDDQLLAAAYRRADVFVMPNVPVPGDIEGFGLVALEAAASGLPVVAADLEGIREAVQHERNGLLVASRDATAWSAALSSLLARPPQERSSLGDSFRTFTIANYGWDQVAARYLSEIRSIVAPAAHRPAAARPSAGSPAAG